MCTNDRFFPVAFLDRLIRDAPVSSPSTLRRAISRPSPTPLEWSTWSSADRCRRAAEVLYEKDLLNGRAIAQENWTCRDHDRFARRITHWHQRGRMVWGVLAPGLD